MLHAKNRYETYQMRVYYECQGPITWVDFVCWVHAKTKPFQNTLILQNETQ